MKLESPPSLLSEPFTGSGELIAGPRAVGSFNRAGVLICLLAIFLTGVFFRLPPALFSTGTGLLRALAGLHPNPKWTEFDRTGPDEKLYRGYVEELSEKGLGHYPDIIHNYIETQTSLTGSILPPTRFLYIFAGYLWHSVFGTDALTSLKCAASFFSILTLALAVLLGWRMRGPRWSVALAALVAVAPTQIHMSQHALVDGFFTFCTTLTLWLLWENLKATRHWSWLGGYTVSLALLVLTKENAFFVWIGIVVVLAANRWLRYGKTSPALLIATLCGPILGILALVILAGDLQTLTGLYELLIKKNSELSYAIQTGDGPWQRYLVDLLLVSPVILLLAIGAIFRMDRTKGPELFLLLFVVGSYVVMCNIPYGMNLRYANIWDVPLRFLALSTLFGLTTLLQKRGNLLLVLSLVGICTLELLQYLTLFVEHPLHELATDGLLRALDILK